MKSVLKIAAVAALAAAVSACSTPTKVTNEGTTDNPVWPRWDSVTFDKNRGTFPDLTSLQEVKAGVTKDQLYHLIGRPHYDEVWRPREWNYLFHFHTPGVGTDDVTTCQFKVLFDKDKFAREFYWNPIDPINAACPPLAAPAAPAPQVIVQEVQVQAPAAPQVQRYTLNADALFAFDRYTLNDMLPAGRAQITDLAAKLKTFDQLNSVLVVGHTDRLGSDAYNLTLSQRRAQTVANYLVAQGVPSQLIRSFGAGETQPVKECDASQPRPQQIECLQPNRRVEVVVDGSGVLLNPAQQ